MFYKEVVVHNFFSFIRWLLIDLKNDIKATQTEKLSHWFQSKLGFMFLVIEDQICTCIKILKLKKV